MIKEGQLITDGTVTWKVQSLNSEGIAGGSDVPGTIKMFAGNTIPDGYLLCDGSAVSRTDYADLFAAIGGTWGAGNGSTTFNLPNSIGRFPEGAAAAGGYRNAGLPNITGIANAQPNMANGWQFIQSGCFAPTNSYASSMNGESSKEKHYALDFNAARCSGIYGASATVQPNAFLVRYIIKY